MIVCILLLSISCCKLCYPLLMIGNKNVVWYSHADLLCDFMSVQKSSVRFTTSHLVGQKKRYLFLAWIFPGGSIYSCFLSPVACVLDKAWTSKVRIHVSGAKIFSIGHCNWNVAVTICWKAVAPGRPLVSVLAGNVPNLSVLKMTELL